MSCPQTVNDFVDSDISGLGVRVSFYLQSFLLVILVDRSWEEAPTALWTFIATNFGLIIAGIIQFKKQELSLLEALQVSNLVWLANFGIFVALASYSRHKRNSHRKKGSSSVAGGPKKKDKEKEEKEESDYRVKTAAMVTTVLSMGLTLYMWATAETFGHQSVECISSLHYYLFIWKIPIVHSGRIVGLTFSTVITCAYIGVTLHEYWTSYQKRKSRKAKKASSSHLPPTSPSLPPPVTSPGFRPHLLPPPPILTTSPTSSTVVSSTVLSRNIRSNSLLLSPPLSSPSTPTTPTTPKPRRSRPERKEWSKIDPMLIGILIFQILVFVYLIVSNELLLKDNNADSGQFGFGQILALIVVLPVLLSVISAFKEHGYRPRQGKSTGTKRRHRPSGSSRSLSSIINNV